MLFQRYQVTISPTNLSPVVSICSIVCLLLSTLSVAGRIFTKAAVVRRLAVDDVAILSATVPCNTHYRVGIAETVCLDLEYRTDCSDPFGLSTWIGETLGRTRSVAQRWLRKGQSLFR